jgi:ketosteroid isomerase-like protein
MIGAPRAALALLLVCAPSAAVGEEGEHAVVETLRAYEQAWSRHDARAIASFYYEPALRITAGGPVMRQTRSDQEAFFSGFMASLVKRGYARSSWEDLEVHLLDAETAIASGISVRFKTDGSQLERVGLTYALRSTPEGWKIFLSSTHATERMLRFRRSAP